MKLAIVGTRNLESYRIFSEKLRTYFPDMSSVDEIVSGGAQGTDSLAEQFADATHIPFKVFKPDYEKYGERAPLLRNSEIADYADMAIAFVDDSSRVTWDIVKKFHTKDKPVTLIKLTDEQRVLDSYRDMELCEPGFEEFLETNRRAGMFNNPCPAPNYRLHVKINGKIFQEGGYFHYREDAEVMKRLLQSEKISVEIEELLK